jgi:hypothetical protein
MSEASKNEYPQSFTVKIPKGREQEFYAKQKASGQSRNAYVMEACFGDTRHRPGEYKFLGQILAKCGLLAQALRSLSQRPDEELQGIVGACLEELRIIRTAIMQRFGRKS